MSIKSNELREISKLLLYIDAVLHLIDLVVLCRIFAGSQTPQDRHTLAYIL